MDTLIYWRKAQQVWPMLLAHSDPVVLVNPRLVKTAGLCWTESGRIELSGPFLRKFPEHMLGQILAHETAHYIDHCLNGWYKYKRHHGKPWQKIMYNLGFNPEPFHTMEL